MRLGAVRGSWPHRRLHTGPQLDSHAVALAYKLAGRDTGTVFAEGEVLNAVT